MTPGGWCLSMGTSAMTNWCVCVCERERVRERWKKREGERLREHVCACRYLSCIMKLIKFVSRFPGNWYSEFIKLWQHFKMTFAPKAAAEKKKKKVLFLSLTISAV